MKRQAIGDSGSWFDIESAKRYDESRVLDGRNHISDATGTQFEHEAIYHTKTGKWVKNWWSQWQGTPETWEIIDEDEATRWLIQNNHELDAQQEKTAESSEI